MKIRKKWFIIPAVFVIAVILATAGGVWYVIAQGSYTATITSTAFPGQTITLTGTSLEELMLKINNGIVKQYWPTFDTATDPLSINGTYSGVAFSIDLPANGSGVTVSVPSTGFNQTFDAGNRDGTFDAMVGDFYTNGGESGLITRVLAGGAGSGGGCFIAIAGR